MSISSTNAKLCSFSIWLIALMVVIQGQGAPPAKIVAEGTYGKSLKIASSWSMVARDKGYEVRVYAGDENASSDIFTAYLFSADLNLLRFSLHANNFLYECRTVARISCELNSQKRKFKASIDVAKPYRVVSSEQFPSDVFWSTGSMLYHIPRELNRPVETSVVGINEDASQFQLKVVDKEQFAYLGEETLALSFGSIRSFKFPSSGWTYWISTSGIILAFQTNVPGDSRVELLSISGPLRNKLLGRDSGEFPRIPPGPRL